MTQTLSEKIAAAKLAAQAGQTTQPPKEQQEPPQTSGDFNSHAEAEKTLAAQAKPTKSSAAERVFFGEFGPSIAYLTPKGTTVHFYQGYCVSDNPEVIEYCKTLDIVEDVTDQVNIEDVPRPGSRSRQRNFGGTAERTTITPGELLSRAVRVQSTAQLPQAAASNSGVAP